MERQKKESVMKKIFDAIRHNPMRTMGAAMVIGAVLVPSALLAWGPDRPTYTMQQPADHVTFNSITDNPTHGDERNFVQIKESGAANSTYGENVALQPGKEYDVYVYFHNNAADNLNDAAHDYKGMAKNAFMRVQMPEVVKAGEKARVTAFVGASNANPAQVWDEAYMSASDSSFALRYVPNSATIYSNGAIDGQKLPDNLYTTGTSLGYNNLDGTVPGCNKYAGYVIFKVRADQPNFEIQKQVSKTGENKYAEQVSVNPKGEVEFKIQYRNTGSVQQDNVVIKDRLPQGLTYVDGSTQVATSKTNGKWQSVSDNGVIARGINIGSYAPNGNAFVKFKATVADNDKLAKCGVNTFVNTAVAETDNGSKSDTASVNVSKVCEEKPEQPVPPAPTKPVGPEVPSELPTTGPSDGLMAVIGAGSLIASAGYYIASRRSLIG